MSERADFFFLPEHLGMGETRYGRSSVVLAPIPKKGLEEGGEGGGRSHRGGGFALSCTSPLREGAD